MSDIDYNRRSSEPIRWTTTRSTREVGNNYQVARDDAGKPMRDEGGSPIVERMPSLGHVYDSDPLAPAGPELHPLAKSRIVETVRHDGHIVHHVLTGASGNLDLRCGDALDSIDQAHYYGWFPWRGHCLLRTIKADHVRRDRIADETLLDPKEKVCPTDKIHPDRPCVHAIRERDARRKRNNHQMRQLEDRHRATAIHIAGGAA